MSKKTGYKAAFVKKILQGDKDFADGKGRKVSLDELNNLLKLLFPSSPNLW